MANRIDAVVEEPAPDVAIAAFERSLSISELERSPAEEGNDGVQDHLAGLKPNLAPWLVDVQELELGEHFPRVLRSLGIPDIEASFDVHQTGRADSLRVFSDLEVGLAFPGCGALESSGSAEDLMLSALANDRQGERVVLELIYWPEAERGKMIALFCELRCSASIQMEIVERVSEIALRQGRNRSEIQASPEVQDILKDPDRNHRQKTQALRDLLQSWRFPRWWARQEYFERSLSSAELPAQIGIVPPPAFEGNSWLMQIRFSSREELSQLLTYARSLASSPKIDQLLAPPDLGPSATVPERHERH